MLGGCVELVVVYDGEVFMYTVMIDRKQTRNTKQMQQDLRGSVVKPASTGKRDTSL